MAQLYFHMLHTYASARCLVNMVSVTVLQLFELESLSSAFRGKSHFIADSEIINIYCVQIERILCIIL